MDAKIKEILNNKSVENLTQEEIEFLRKVVRKANGITSNKFVSVFSMTLSTLSGLLLGIGTSNVLIAVIMMLGGVGASWLVYSTDPNNYIKLKDLNITKKEWKELEKSGRLKELKQMMKEFEKTPNAELMNLEKEEEKWVTELTLIQRRIKVNQIIIKREEEKRNNKSMIELETLNKTGEEKSNSDDELEVGV